jgi:hypothetical protein
VRRARHFERHRQPHAYHDGVEHYVTAFELAGADATEVGSIVPLPGVPTKVSWRAG